VDNEKFYLHRGLLANAIKNDREIQNFLEKIDGRCEKDHLENLMRKIYKGYGAIKEEDKRMYEVKIPDSLEDY
jgi:hypothetical protein